MRPPRRVISSGSPFERASGYSRAVVLGDEIHISGTTGYDYATMTMPDDPAEQARNIYATFAEVLMDAGSELADIVRLRTYVTDAAFFEPVLKVQGEAFRRHPSSGDDRDRRRAAKAGDEGRDRGGRADRSARIAITRARAT